MVMLCGVEFEIKRGVLPERDKLRQHPRRIHLDCFPQISQPGERLSPVPANVRLMLGFHARRLDLQQSFFRRSQQTLEPDFFLDLSFKDSEALLRKGIAVDQQPQMVGQAFSQLPLQQRTMQKIETTMLQSPERCHQVAAVHGGNKPGRKRLESARVIPVQQVSTLPRNLGHCRQSAQRLFGKFRNGEKSELASHLAGIEEKTQVRR